MAAADGLIDLLRADAAASRRWRPQLVPFLYPCFFAVASFRLSVALHRRGHVYLARLVQVIAQTLTGAELDPKADVGPGLVLIHTGGVLLGQGVKAGRDLTLFAGVTVGSNFGESRSNPRQGFPVLGDEVRVFTNASIIGPVRVGDRVSVGAHALVLKDVPDGAVAKGVPARWSLP